MSQTLGQQIVIENIGGAGGRSPPPAWPGPRPTATRCYCTRSEWRGQDPLSELPFDPEKDFAGIGLVNTSASTICGAPDAAAGQHGGAAVAGSRSRAEPEVAHAGVGAFGHLAGVLFAQEIGVKVRRFPTGRRPGAQRPVRRPCRWAWQPPSQAALIKAGKLKGYAIVVRTGSPACRRWRPWWRTATRSSISNSGTRCSHRPLRRGR